MFDELADFMKDKKLPHPNKKDIKIDGKFHRYCKDGTSKKDEWYIGEYITKKDFWCSFGTHSTSTDPDKAVHRYRSWNNDSDISPEERESYRKQVEQAEQIKKDYIQEVIKKIVSGIKDLPKTSDHPYLKKKGILEPQIFNKDIIVIPVYNHEGYIQTVQSINKDGTKKFYNGLPFAGGRYVFGKPEKGNELLIAEGFATSYSLHVATGKPVICAFSSHNIPYVAQQIKTDGYILTHAQDLGAEGDRIAKVLDKMGIKSVKPRFNKPSEGKDFNDLLLEEGKDSVNNCFNYPIALKRLVDVLSDDVPELEWYIDKLIMKGSINVIWSAPGLGKSTFCYAMGLHATIGKDFIRRQIPNKLKVLYVDGEMTAPEIKSKVSMVLNAMELTEEELPDPESFKMLCFQDWEELYGEPIDLYSSETRARMDANINLFNPDLIFLDNLSCLTGTGDEPDYSKKEESWKNINAWLKRLIKKNIGVVIVHHSNKSGTISGTGAILRSVVTEIELRKHEDNPNEELIFQLRFNKTRHLFGNFKKSKIIYFDYRKKNYFKLPFPKQGDMTSGEYKDYLYQKCSHWLDLPLPDKDGKQIIEDKEED